MNKKIYNLVLAALVTVILSACTTTTTTLSREVSVGYDEEVKNAKIAFSQKNYIVAAKLLKPLAERGRGDAQYALGYLYFNGLGVPLNKSLAAKWFNSAAANGNENAKQALLHMPSFNSAVIDLRGKKESLSDPMPVLTDKTDVSKESPVDGSMIAEPNIDQPEDIEGINNTASSDTGASYDGKKLTDGEKWIDGQQGNHFTIQLIVLVDESALKIFINENNLQNNSAYYRIQKNGKTFYALVHGSFESYGLAKEVVAGMSAELMIANPWIRKISDIQKLLSTH